MTIWRRKDHCSIAGRTYKYKAPSIVRLITVYRGNILTSCRTDNNQLPIVVCRASHTYLSPATSKDPSSLHPTASITHSGQRGTEQLISKRDSKSLGPTYFQESPYNILSKGFSTMAYHVLSDIILLVTCYVKLCCLFKKLDLSVSRINIKTCFSPHSRGQCQPVIPPLPLNTTLLPRQPTWQPILTKLKHCCQCIGCLRVGH